MAGKQEKKVSDNRVMQQENGIVSLEMNKAGRYTDEVNPKNNTADWNVVISKPGRFTVWLSSTTKDTADLKREAVRISMLDNQLDGTPQKVTIVPNEGSVHSPYIRTESFMGTVYVPEPGEYNIQVISEKVIADNMNTQFADTKFIALILTPEMR